MIYCLYPGVVSWAVIIAIEGMDKAGKQTQSAMLQDALAKRGISSRIFHFPDYGTDIGGVIERRLEPQGRDGSADAPQALHCLLAANRWEHLHSIRDACSRYDVVIMDRYYPSNIAYGTANGMDPGWLANLDEGLPAPDIVILLDIPVPVSFERSPAMRDSLERDREFLEAVRAEYRALAGRGGWRIIPADGPERDVHEAVLGALPSHLGGGAAAGSGGGDDGATIAVPTHAVTGATATTNEQDGSRPGEASRA